MKSVLVFVTLLTTLKSELPHLPFLKKISKHQKPPDCGQYTVQLTRLLVLMCENVALNREDDFVKDACIGCFQQASTVNNNQPSLENLRDCAERYLTETIYEDCSSQIDIAECYRQASADNDAIFEEEQVILVKNITSCILARTRCAPINPITGQRQSASFQQTTYDKWGKPTTALVPYYNSLQISAKGDLRIIRLPGSIKIQDYFCTQPNLQESTWLEYSC